jgi:hypothetical protein
MRERREGIVELTNYRIQAQSHRRSGQQSSKSQNQEPIAGNQLS